jgi:D-sedoheptulose 7-phosphate isomerase
MSISTADEAADPRVAAALEESIAVKRAVLEALVGDITKAAGWLVESLRSERKVLLFGNGGSAADCQHIAAELVGRFEREGRGLSALALTVDTSALTALTNDYGFEAVFARQIQALAQSGDVAMAFSTSGESPNVIAGVEAARKTGVRTIALTGSDGGRLAGLSDLTIRVPSSRTSRIQEAHITICHAICEIVEAELRQ